MRRPRGMTLMEVLIAVTLVALLSTGMLFALRAGIGSVQSINRHVQNVRKATSAQRILEQQFAGLMPVQVVCRGGADQQSAGSAVFFDGEPTVMRFVTAYSLEEASRGRPQIVELFVIPMGTDNGVRLVVNEIPYVSPPVAGLMCAVQSDPSAESGALVLFPAPQASPRSFVLADRLARVSFRYQKLSLAEPYERWLPRWVFPDALPDAVRIDMEPLAPDPSGIPPLPFFARIQANRRLGEAIDF